MKRILITGANRGFGLALAQLAYQQGHSLYLVVRSDSACDILRQQFPEARVVICDITDDGYPQRLEAWLGEEVLDVVINNAGSGTKAPTLADTESAYLRKEFETNCIGPFATVKGALKAMTRATRPLLINISSRRGSLTLQSQLAAKGSGCSYSYRISKAAQNMLTLCLADDLEELGIRCVALHPGRMVTSMAASDAHMTPQQSAAHLLELIEHDQLQHRDFVSLEQGSLPW
ncbi:SDR family oxidoreductase [Vibrio olivae]|uniref:SDR family oxidoreductase n=1 Tax=Vibrio olivae TaxID=1243002 RepID=A0ABV5HTN8_9VIBR